MNRLLSLLLLGALLLPICAVEPWADPGLPVKDAELWFDAARQNHARKAAASRELPPTSTLDQLFDASGKRRHLHQFTLDARPQFKATADGALVLFDGKNDSLTAGGLNGSFTNITVFIVAAPLGNAGGFPGLISFNQHGANDYTTGLNLDLGPWPTPALAFMNVEGAGFTGAAQILESPIGAFGVWHVFTLTGGADGKSLGFRVDGKPQASRPRADKPYRMDNFALGARIYSNSGDAPHAQSFFHGQIAEAIVYGRALSETERARVEEYLSKKHAKFLSMGPALASNSKPLQSVTNPPPVQMLVPGFTARELPLKLRNINNIKYRPDGKAVAVAYEGKIHLLSDTDGDGLEDKVEPFWSETTIRSPIGMALTPPGYALGEGVFVAGKGKVSLIVDTDKDSRADKEIIVAEGWTELPHGVDALGVAVDKQGNVYFGLGAENFTDAYLIDKATGKARYSLTSERGTILKVSPDFKNREIYCTGIRFPVAMAFNAEGDLFCTDQEGATWLPNGNPLDELLYIQKGRHYGFPPRHPKHLPDVIDEPSVFDYEPQHQSTCGLNFNEPVNGGPIFGPDSWRGDAIVCGYSRGKIWRTKLVKVPPGYVAKTELIAALPDLTVDACVTPAGDLLVATHSGAPDWGSGPTGDGKLYKISYTDKSAPQPVATWSSSPTELRVAFDKPLEPARMKDLAKRIDLTRGQFAFAGDRFEAKRPGYAVVYSQMTEARHDSPVQSVTFTPDWRTMIVHARPRLEAWNESLTISNFVQNSRAGIPQHPDIDLSANLHGLEATWTPKDGKEWRGWLPHPDLDVSRALTTGSSEHEELWRRMEKPGTLRLRGQLNIWEMLQPAIQPGSTLDYKRPPENVWIGFGADQPFVLSVDGAEKETAVKRGDLFAAKVTRPGSEAWVPFELELTASSPPTIGVVWQVMDGDEETREFALRRFFMPWARPAQGSKTTNEVAIPELAGGNWLAGKRVFFNETVGCYKCHTVRGEGTKVGPDLSNLVHRDYASVLKDIREPNAALNPDHLSYAVEFNDGESVSGVLQGDTAREIRLADASGKSVTIPKSNVKTVRPTALSLMPEGLLATMTANQLRDLMTFLLVTPLEPAPIEIPNEPKPRTRTEVDAVLKGSTPSSTNSQMRIVLCAGPKDHGPGEHDYPMWQKRWTKLLGLAENVEVTTAWEWPSAEQLQKADTIVFFSNNPKWDAARAAEFAQFQKRGGGSVFIHYAVDGHKHAKELADAIGMAWQGGRSKFRHGALDLKLEATPFTKNFPGLELVDESYWQFVGDYGSVQLVASSVEDGKPQPQLWAATREKARVFVSIPGHYNWTFDDPLFRILLLRGICWTANQPLDRLAELATIGARVAE